MSLASLTFSMSAFFYAFRGVGKIVTLAGEEEAAGINFYGVG